MKHARRFGGFVVAICLIVLHTLAVDSAAATQTSGMVANATTLTVTTANAVATFAGLDLVGFVNALTNETYLKKPSNGHFATGNALSATPPAQQCRTGRSEPSRARGFRLPRSRATTFFAFRR
jgi:hypothetical protein